MNRERVKDVAENHAKIWFYNDLRQNDKLSEAVTNMLRIKLGGNRSVNEAATEIRRAYETYGNMDDEPDKHNVQEVFATIESCFSKAFTLLGENNPNEQAKYYRDFWYNFFHKKNNPLRNLKIIKAIWMLHWHKFSYKSTINLTKTSRSAYHYIAAGIRGHNKRDFESTIKHLERYWGVTPAYHNIF